MLIFDAHLDLAWNGVDWGRDLTLPLAEIRAREAHLMPKLDGSESLTQGGMTELGRGTNTVCFPEMRRGEVGICLATLYNRMEHKESGTTGLATPHACYAMGMAHLAYYRSLERAGLMRQIRTKRDLQQQLDCWNFDSQRTPFGYIVSMECADMIVDADYVDEFYQHGVRTIGLTHYGVNRYGGGTRTDVGLNPSAKQILQRMEELKIPLDLTHTSDPSFWDAVKWYNGRVLASHQNARKFADWQRQFTDDMIKAVIERDGILGMVFDAIMLQPGFERGKTKPTVTLARTVENIDHICQLAGNTKHVGIGSDLDGGYGTEQTPADLDSIADIQKLRPLLEKRGYSLADITGIFYGNWLRFFNETLPD